MTVASEPKLRWTADASFSDAEWGGNWDAYLDRRRVGYVFHVKAFGNVPAHWFARHDDSQAFWMAPTLEAAAAELAAFVQKRCGPSEAQKQRRSR